MSEPENFLERWSRRKRDAAAEAGPIAPDDTASPPEMVATDESAPSKVEAPRNEAPEFDVSQLPSLDSIDATSDLRAFMQPGVPSELKHAALRRAWAADADIRDFIGLAENSGDFNNPGQMPGFGALPEGENIVELVRQVLGTSSDEVAPESSSNARGDSKKPPVHERIDDAASVDGYRSSGAQSDVRSDVRPDVAAQDDRDAATHDEAPEPSGSPKRRRGHGGALPT
jgi:hypothetical protein